MAPILRCILLLLYLPFSIAAAVNPSEQSVQQQKTSQHKKPNQNKPETKGTRETKPQQEGVPDPDHDVFYTPPPGFEKQPLGTVLKTRKIDSTFLGFFPSGVETWQLLYRTNVIGGQLNSSGVPDVSVTTVFKPDGAMTDRFVSFHTHYDFSAKICNPSYTYQLGAEQTDIITNEEYTTLSGFLIGKYIISSPDYQGRESAFSAGRLAGMVTLDSMRAVANFGKTLGLTTDKPAIVGYGYSGGSIASGWGANMQKAYAPELNIKGWSMGGVVANIRNVAYHIDKTVYSGFNPAAIVGLNKPTAYGALLHDIYASIVTPYGQSLLDYASTHCLTTLFNFFEKSIFDTSVQKLGKKIFDQPTISRCLDENVLGQQTPIAPLHIYNAKADEITPYEDVTKLVDNWCSQGAAINYITLSAGGHLTSESLGFTDAYKFVQAAFAGTVPTQGCTKSTKNDPSIDPTALGYDLEPILFRLIDILFALGMGDGTVKSDLHTLDQKPGMAPENVGREKKNIS